MILRSVHAHRHAYVHVFDAAHACKYNDGLHFASVFDIACALYLPASTYLQYLSIGQPDRRDTHPVF